MQIIQTQQLKKAVNSLSAEEKAALELAIKAIAFNPLIGVFDNMVRILRFDMAGHPAIISYEYNALEQTLYFIALDRIQ